MKIIKMIGAAVGLGAITLACVAQEDEEKAPDVFTYATYFNCGGGPLAVADAEIEADTARMDALVDAGKLLHWGYMAHHTGGQWQRILYYQANSLDALLDGGDAIDDSGDDEGDEADSGPNFGSVCNRHDDYIWQVENGGGDQGDRGKVGFSVYHVCDSNREDRADEIVAEHAAPIFNKLVEDGKLKSWGWSSHVVGGRFRKLQTMTATDHKTLLAARGEAIAAMYDDDNALGKEFVDICGEHVDYMWNIQHEK